jgi:N-acetylmuramoyl-L-alanine amidase
MATCPTCNQEVQNKPLLGKIVALDVGHGWGSGAGFDVGAVGNNTNEQALNAEVGRLVKSDLESKGAEVHLFDYTSEGSPKLFLRQKGKRAGDVKADVFISIHHNAFDGSVNGTETLVDEQATQEDMKLAKSIQNSMFKELGYHNRGVKRQNLGILKGCPTSIPACLTEGFFIDWKYFQGKVPSTATVGYANGLARGIELYLTEPLYPS